MIRNNDVANYGELPPSNYNLDEIMVGFLIDCSGSMANYINDVARELNYVIAELASDKVTSKMVEVAVMTYNDEAYLLQDFRPVTETNEIKLTASGGTETGPAMEDITYLIKDRGDRLEDDNMTIRTPFIFHITDGYGGDVTKAAALVKERTDAHKLQLWSLGVGDYDKATMKAFHPDGKRLFKMKVDATDSHNAQYVREAYKEFFDKIVLASVKAVSHKCVGESVSMEDPTKNADSQLAKPMLDEDWLQN